MASQFNDLADFYDKPSVFLTFRPDIELPSVLALIGDAKEKSVLDFGCGSGFYCRAIKKHGAAEVVGYDISEGGMVSYAKDREDKDPLGISYTTELTPGMDGRFDLVVSVYVLPYASSRQELHAMFSDMAKVLRPGGRLIALPMHPDCDPDPKYYEPYGFRLVSEVPYVDGGAVRLEICQEPDDICLTAYYWSASSLEQGMYQAGFEHIRWLKPTRFRDGPIEHAPYSLYNYIKRPHVATFECRMPV